MIYAATMYPGGWLPARLAASFHEATAFDFRIRIVKQAINHMHVGQLTDEFKLLRDDWKALEKRLKKANKLRNKIAHGTLIIPDDANGHPRLPVWVPYFERITYHMSKSPYGRPLGAAPEELSTGDIQAIIDEVIAVTNEMNDFLTRHFSPDELGKGSKEKPADRSGGPLC